MKLIVNNLEVCKLCIPSELENDVILETHERYGHYGPNKVFNILNRIVIIPKMKNKVIENLKSCDSCQKAKYSRITSGPLIPIIPDRVNQILSVDIYGTLPENDKNEKFVFAVIDIFSKFLKLYPVVRRSGEYLLNLIIEDWVRNVGYPEKILSESTTNFTGSPWKDPLEEHGIEIIYTTNYNPQGNPIERVMREISRFMRTYCKTEHANWAKYLPFLEHCHNNVMHSSTGCTPYELIYNRRHPSFLEDIIDFLPHYNIPRDVMLERANNNLRRAASYRKRYYDRKIKFVDFQPGDLVLLRSHKLSNAKKKLTKKIFPLFTGPYVIMRRYWNNTAKLYDRRNNKRKGIHNFRNLRPYYHKD